MFCDRRSVLRVSALLRLCWEYFNKKSEVHISCVCVCKFIRVCPGNNYTELALY